MNRTGRYFVPEPESSSSSNETEDFASASEGHTEEQDHLTSSFYTEELSPFEPRPNPFQNFLTSLLHFNLPPQKPNEMASASNTNQDNASPKEAKNDDAQRILWKTNRFEPIHNELHGSFDNKQRKLPER